MVKLLEGWARVLGSFESNRNWAFLAVLFSISLYLLSLGFGRKKRILPRRLFKTAIEATHWWGRKITLHGYVEIRSPSGKIHFEHRRVAAAVLGRALSKNEVVHHINGKRDDNRPANLCVMDRREHDRYHGWYDWIHEKYGNYPRRETQLRKLREDFGGQLLMDYMDRKSS